MCGCGSNDAPLAEAVSTPTINAEPSAEPTPEPAPEPTVAPEILSEEEARATQIWNLLSEHFDNPYAIAGIMGNMSRESRLCPWRYEGDNSENFIRSSNMADIVNIDLSFPTRESRYYFTYFGLSYDGRTGFGLCQWTALGYKVQLYDMAVETGRNIDDVELQIDFLMMTLNRDHPELIDILENDDGSLIAVQHYLSVYEKGVSGDADLFRRHEAAEEILALFAPEYADERFTSLSKEEIYKNLDIPVRPAPGEKYVEPGVYY